MSPDENFKNFEIHYEDWKMKRPYQNWFLVIHKYEDNCNGCYEKMCTYIV